VGRVHLAPEERLLLALGRLRPSAAAWEEARRILEAPSFRWERAVELASYHRVHLLLARSLDGAPLRDLVPSGVRARLQQVRMAAELRNERSLHAIAEPLARLAAEGIPVLLLKGAALVATTFPPGSRPLNDIDLLIRRGDYPRVSRALEEAGFRKTLQEGRSEEETLRDYHEVSFLRRVRNETLSVDLHWHLFTKDRQSSISAMACDLRTGDLLSRAAPATLGPAHALAPSAEDCFVHIATQIGNDSLDVHLGRLMDLDALVGAGLDMRRLVAIATAARAAGTTYLALSLVASLGAPVPRDALARLRAACPPSAVAGRVLATPALPFVCGRLRTAARLALLPLLFGRPSQRLAYYLSLVVPAAGARRHHILRKPDSARAYLRRWRVAGLAACCGLLLLAERAARALGLRGLAARMCAALWHPADRPSRAHVRERTPARETLSVG
jgi:hypothetical protein